MFIVNIGDLETGEQVRILRQRKSLSRADLARVANVSPQTVYRYEAKDQLGEILKTLNQILEPLGARARVVIEQVQPPISGFASELISNAPLTQDPMSIPVARASDQFRLSVVPKTGESE